MKNIVVVSCLVLSLIVSQGFAASNWTNDGGDNLWRNTANWTGTDASGLPSQSLQTIVGKNGPDRCIIDSSTNALSRLLHLGWSAAHPNGEIEMTGGTLDVGPTNQSIWVGKAAGYQGTFSISDGSVFIGDGGRLTAGKDGTGYIYVTGGTIDAPQLKISESGAAHGEIYLHGGRIDLRNAFDPSYGTGTGFLEITEGILTLPKYQETTEGPFDVITNINEWIANDSIIGYGSTDDNLIVVSEYVENGQDRYQITAVPEPASLCLFGLSGLYLLRRKK